MIKPEYVSASRTNTYKDCPFRYFLQYHLFLEELNKPSIATEKGSAVHLALEKHVEGLDASQALIDYYKKSALWTLDNRKPDRGFPHPVEKDCANCKWAEWSAANNQFHCKIADKLVSNFEGCPKPNFEDDLQVVNKTIKRNEDVYKRKILGTEVPFDIDYGTFRLHGYMDLVTEINSTTIEVRDYKSGNWAKNFEETFQDIQMRIYSIAAKHVFPQYSTVIMTLDYLRKSPISVVFGPKDDAKTLERVAEINQLIINSSDPPRVKTFKCSWCVGYERCGEIREQYLDANGNFKLPPPGEPKNKGRKLPIIEE